MGVHWCIQNSIVEISRSVGRPDIGKELCITLKLFATFLYVHVCKCACSLPTLQMLTLLMGLQYEGGGNTWIKLPLTVIWRAGRHYCKTNPQCRYNHPDCGNNYNNREKLPKFQFAWRRCGVRVTSFVKNKSASNNSGKYIPYCFRDSYSQDLDTHSKAVKI